jgi:hypothetical protein
VADIDNWGLRLRDSSGADRPWQTQHPAPYRSWVLAFVYIWNVVELRRAGACGAKDMLYVFRRKGGNADRRKLQLLP